jgi:hypothetical protein
VVPEVPRLSHDASFVLTTAGEAFWRSLGESPPNGGAQRQLPNYSLTASSLPEPAPVASVEREKPIWDPDRRELTYCGRLVKSYRVPSPNQELILSVFEEEGWPEFVDDPLPPVDELEPHRRLQATVKSLNRKQVNKLIRFRGNGGMKVFWKVMTEA